MFPERPIFKPTVPNGTAMCICSRGISETMAIFSSSEKFSKIEDFIFTQSNQNSHPPNAADGNRRGNKRPGVTNCHNLPKQEDWK